MGVQVLTHGTIKGVKDKVWKMQRGSRGVWGGVVWALHPCWTCCAGAGWVLVWNRGSALDLLPTPSQPPNHP